MTSKSNLQTISLLGLLVPIKTHKLRPLTEGNALKFKTFPQESHLISLCMINVVNPDESSTQSFSKRRLAFGLVLMSQTIFATSWRTLLSSLVLWADPDCNFLATKFSRCKMQCMNAQSFDFSFIKTYLIFHSLKKILVHQLVHQFFSFTNSKFLFTKKWTIHRVQKRCNRPLDSHALLTNPVEKFYQKHCYH